MDDQKINIVTPASQRPAIEVETQVTKGRRATLGERYSKTMGAFADGEPLLQEERAKLAPLDDPELVREFHEAKLGSGFDLTKIKAQHVFSKILYTNIDLPTICQTRSLANIGEAEMMKEFALNALKRHEHATSSRQDGIKFEESDIMDHETHLAFLKLALLGTAETAKMLERAHKMARASGAAAQETVKAKRQLADFSQSITNINIGGKLAPDGKPEPK